jgi:hypothetical protein
MAPNEKVTFPKLPEKNWWVLRDQFAKSMPKEVTVGYLKTLLQLSSEDSARNLLSPLRQLGLIDEDSKPTDLANNWRNDQKYADACSQMREIYPEELRDLFPVGSVDRKKLEDWFKYNGKLGDAAAKQATSLYLLLLDSKPKSSVEFMSSKSTRNSNDTKNTRTRQSTTTNKNKPEISVPPKTSADTQEKQLSTKTVPGDNLENWFSLHIDLQIHISPEASADQIDNIFASMAKHIISMRRDADDKPKS